ncbi:hypothetical protein C8R46DRAFT_1029304 [Mycena filopes]|nr:hypothetical protein C8R46DRAFT_1029304 [Mycena filopes]
MRWCPGGIGGKKSLAFSTSSAEAGDNRVLGSMGVEIELHFSNPNSRRMDSVCSVGSPLSVISNWDANAATTPSDSAIELDAISMSSTLVTMDRSDPSAVVGSRSEAVERCSKTICSSLSRKRGSKSMGISSHRISESGGDGRKLGNPWNSTSRRGRMALASGNQIRYPLESRAGFAGFRRGMGDTVLDVDSGLRSERPEPEGEAAVDEHCSRHALDDLVGSFGDAILLGRIWNYALVRDPLGLAVVLELAVDYLRRVVDSKEHDEVAKKFLGGGGEIAAAVIVESDEVFETPIPNGQGTTNVGVNTEERAVGTIGGFAAREFEPLDVGESANAAVFDQDTVDRQSCGGVLKPFNVYVAD